jgi:regulator of RNase E activity RraB
MKKVLLTAVVALSTLVASAQFMVVTSYDGDQTETMDKITSNMGIGYMVNDAFTVGLAKGDNVITTAGVTGVDAVADNPLTADVDETVVGVAEVAEVAEDGYDIWVRYNIAQMEGAYAALQMPTKDGSDNMKVGVGFAFNVWNGLYVEPNYMMPTSEDAVTKKREGTFSFGLSYRF